MITAVLDFPHCTLLIEWEGEMSFFDLTGDLDQVSATDRERIANALARRVGISHDESYRMLWATDEQPAEDE